MSRMSGSVSTRDIILSGSIGVQKEINLEELTVTENGEYNPGEEYDGFSKVTVEVPDPVLEDITITENGHYTPPEGVDGYDDITVAVPEPEPKLLHLYDEVTTNGNHVYKPSDYGDYDGFSQVNMVTNVPIRVHDKTFTANGVYPPEENYDGYATVTVNVPTAAVIQSKTITANGTYTAPSGVDGYSPITVNVDGYSIKTLPNTPTPIASFTDGTDNPLKSLTASIVPVQSGSGDPSPTNVRPISGWSGVDIYNNNYIDLVSDTIPNCSIENNGTLISANFKMWVAPVVKDRTYRIVTDADYYIGSFFYTQPSIGSVSYNNSRIITGSKTFKAPITGYACFRSGKNYTGGKCYDLNATTIPFTDSQGNPVEVYGGSVDVVDGVVTPCPYYASYNGEQLTGEWISDRDVYSPNTTPTIGAQVVNIGATGTPFSVQPTSIKSLDGVNNVFASTGDVEELKYFADL